MRLLVLLVFRVGDPRKVVGIVVQAIPIKMRDLFANGRQAVKGHADKPVHRAFRPTLAKRNVLVAIASDPRFQDAGPNPQGI